MALGCGGAAVAPKPETPPKTAPTATTTVAPVSTPAPFTGAFDLVSVNGPNGSVVIADVFKKALAVAGEMSWGLGADSFSVGLWQITRPHPTAEGETDTLYSFCRAAATVSAHWEGMTLVLASTVQADGAGVAMRVQKKVEGPKTTRRTTDTSAGCSASCTRLRMTFEVLEKDADGPTRLRAKSEDGQVELVRGKPIGSIEPKPILDALP